MASSESDILMNHTERCRMCLNLISDNEIFYKIDETMKTKFENLTFVELIISSQFSSLICLNCNKNLEKLCSFREELIENQTKLYELLCVNFEGDSDPPDDEHNNLEPEYLDEEMKYEKVADESETFILQDAENLGASRHIEFFISDTDDSTHFTPSHSASKKILRPQKWNWTDEMELDLVRYRHKYKSLKDSDNLAYRKISQKFQIKGYPNISAKSIKYKYEKLQSQPEKLTKLKEQVEFDISNSDDEELIVRTDEKRRFGFKKTYWGWKEDMEIFLLHLASKIKQQNPVIPDKALFRNIAKEFELEGYRNITEHIVHYHYKKVKQDEAKFQRLSEKANEFETDEDYNEDFQTWTDSADSALVSFKNQLQNLLPESIPRTPRDIWENVKHKLEKNGHGSFTIKSIKNRYFQLMHGNDDNQSTEMECNKEISYGKTSSKRSYLYWTEEMKEALIRHRNDLDKRPSSGDVWETVAKRMNGDGYGNFTAQNVMYKYFNLKRRKLEK
ncbi:CLUMA_CG021548, isoform A [Clunio marinus]|uniref:CLUMA_CG021548, isoform A n=1 Tax=Clunio marinus TaxID=568069 RepID=A0A1J1J9F6_9DIPT|nr:CLUMA_CG021548, isoform A [Clunio marinus]